jgi:hypothetical protein
MGGVVSTAGGGFRPLSNRMIVTRVVSSNGTININRGTATAERRLLW